tara:strand:- start:21974 stop:22264 length:291 start_codon:yes stop_codon:yes gene_type:complete
MAISMAPVSDAGTIPKSLSFGSSNISRVKFITSLNFFFAAVDLCDRPTQAPFKTAGVQPGRLAHGPDEKKGFRGKAVGFIVCSFELYTTWWEVVAR